MKKCGFTRKPCMAHDCEQYIQLQGSHPQTGQPVNEWGCAISWMPILLIETSQQVRQAGASTDKVANTILSLASPEAKKRLASG